MYNKKGYSTGFGFVLALVLLFSTGLLWVVFDYVSENYVLPAGKLDIVNQSTWLNESQKQEVYQDMDKYIVYYKTAPFAIFFVLILFMFINTINDKPNEL